MHQLLLLMGTSPLVLLDSENVVDATTGLRFAIETYKFLQKFVNHYSSVIHTVAYRTVRTILAGHEIFKWDKI
jgi:hypothetical protein